MQNMELSCDTVQRDITNNGWNIIKYKVQNRLWEANSRLGGQEIFPVSYFVMHEGSSSQS